jgi:hypothetical protein
VLFKLAIRAIEFVFFHEAPSEMRMDSSSRTTRYTYALFVGGFEELNDARTEDDVIDKLLPDPQTSVYPINSQSL